MVPKGRVAPSLPLRERFCTPPGACRIASRVPRFSEKSAPSLPGLYRGLAPPAAFVRFQSPLHAINLQIPYPISRRARIMAP
ncbi:hypothetical protein MRX96_055286 [Rhipicephalus microplus]